MWVLISVWHRTQADYLVHQAVGDNEDEIAQLLEDTANKLLAVERTVDNGIPKAAEKAMENLKS